MEGGEKPKEEEESLPPSLVVEVLSEYMKIPITQCEVTTMAKIRALAQPNEEKRAPITICAAIDRSGSMKDHLPLLKETLQFMVQQLRAEDKLCLITFDHEVRVELPLTKMDSSGKLLAEKAIDSVKERGHTNLSGGLLAALEVLYRLPSRDATLVESVLLFTDGKTNVGIKDQAQLEKATRSILTQIERHTCVFTFGYGSEHDTDLLHALASAGNGLFYYIDNKDSIPESFCDCLGGLLSVAAQNIHLTFTAAENVQLCKPLTTFKTFEREANKVYEVTIHDIYCEEEKCILVKVLVPGDWTLEESQNLSLVSCCVEYFDVITCKACEHTVMCGIVRNKLCSNPVNSDCIDEIELHRIRCEVADTLGQANKMANSGNFRGAKDLIVRTTARVKGSVVISRPLAIHLLETLQESLDGLQDHVTYQEHGKAVMQNYAGSHWQQRSNAKPTSVGYSRAKAKAGVLLKPVTDSAVVSPYRNSSKMSLLSRHSSSISK